MSPEKLIQYDHATILCVSGDLECVHEAEQQHHQTVNNNTQYILIDIILKLISG